VDRLACSANRLVPGLERATGFEPATPSLGSLYSTSWAMPAQKIFLINFRRKVKVFSVCTNSKTALRIAATQDISYPRQAWFSAFSNILKLVQRFSGAIPMPLSFTNPPLVIKTFGADLYFGEISMRIQGIAERGLEEKKFPLFNNNWLTFVNNL
jgi:hypothetical protein